MRSVFFLFLMIASQLGHAQTAHEKQIKEQMIARIADIREKVSLARDQLDENDTENACKNIKELFDLVQEHVKDLHGHMDLFSSKVRKASDKSLNDLLTLQKLKLICQQGQNHEYVDIKKFRDELKDISKSVRKQKRTVKRKDADYENEYHISVETEIEY